MEDGEEEKEIVEEKQRILQLEKDVELLATKCSRLEAQNILVSAQQLDIVARLFAILLSGLSLRFYWTSLCWISSYLSWHSYVVVALKYSLLLVPLVHHRLTHGLVHRRFEVFSVFLIIMVRIKLVRWRALTFASSGSTSSSTSDNTVVVSQFGENLDEDAIWEANYDVSAQFLYISILRLRGLWTKSAQYISSRADFMPVAYVRELKKLQDEAPATEWKDIQATLATAPHLMDQVTDIAETPIASASIGQVHIAKLRKTGEKVVIKVQHPQARPLLTDDFRSLLIMAWIVTLLEPEYAFFEILMREWATEARKELEFLTEATNLRSAGLSIQQMMRTFGNNGVLFTNHSDAHPKGVPFQVEIPRPYLELCTQNVLVMTFSEGVRMDCFDKIDEWKIPKLAMMDAMGQAFANLMYTSFEEDDGSISSIFSGDPHVGNQLIRPGTGISDEGFTIVLLDWGLAKRLSEQKRIAFCQIAYAAATFDFGLMLDGFTAVGLKMKRENVAEDMEGIRFLLRDMAPRKEARQRIKAKMKTDQDRMKSKDKKEKVPMESKAYPGEFFFFVRTNELLHGLGSQLAVEMSFLDVIRPYAERGLQQSSLYSDFTEKTVPSYDIKDKTLNGLIEEFLRELDEKKKIAGAQVCILDSNGNMLANVVEGHLGGLKSSLPMRSDALVLGYSCTKAVAATLAHVMVEQGYLCYDDLVCNLWPEFCPQDIPEGLAEKLDLTEEELSERWMWKRSITLRHILTHTSGFWSALPKRMTIKRMSSCESCCEAFEYNSDMPDETLLPNRQPGEKSEYHFMSFGWLVAGTLCSAYALKNNGQKPAFEELYEAILVPKLSTDTLFSGFRPCGGGEGFCMALTEADVQMTRIMQLQREAEAMGQTKNSSDGNWKGASEIQKSFRGSEFLLDPRVWNCGDALHANVPAAGGRFSATGLAYFYRDLGTGKVLSTKTLESVSTVATIENTANDLQGLTAMTTDTDQVEGVMLGLGYQLIKFDNDTEPSAFGHAGVGGSIGFYHQASGISVGIMLNKADGDKDTAKSIIRVVSKYLKW